MPASGYGENHGLSHHTDSRILWNKEEKFAAIPYENEAAIEQAVNEVKDALFGITRISYQKVKLKGAIFERPHFESSPFQYQRVKLKDDDWRGRLGAAF